MCALFVSLAAVCALLLADSCRRCRAFPILLQNPDHQDQRHRALCPRRRQGPAVVLLHGFGDTGDMWAPIAAKLVADHTVIVPDLRGMGLSAHPDTGYTKANEARDIAGVMDALKVEQGRARHPRHRQHGRLCPGGAISGAHHQLGGDRRAAAGHRQLAGAAYQSQDLAFQFLRPR